MPAEHRRQGGPASGEGHVVQLEAAGLGQHLEGDVHGAVRAGRSVGNLPRTAPRILDIVHPCPPGRIRLDHDDQRIGRQQRDRGQRLPVEARLPSEQRIRRQDGRPGDMGDQTRIAVRAGLRGGLHADRAARTAAVLQHHRLVPVPLQRRAEGPRDEVCRAARRKGNDDVHRPVREIRLAESGRRRGGEGQSERRAPCEGHGHGLTPPPGYRALGRSRRGRRPSPPRAPAPRAPTRPSRHPGHR